MDALSLPSLDELRAASERIRPAARVTPLVPLHEHHGADGIYLKLETHQPVGSFKIRGVFNAVASMDDEIRKRGLSTVSAGNTAQALAWAGRFFGVPARSLMPDAAPAAKIQAVEAYGGEPVLVPVEELFRFLKKHGWEDEPYAFVHPWTSRDVMTGHGSMALEIVEALPELETVFIPVGGGGLLAGVGGALEALKPSIRIVAVEPSGCPAFHRSLHAGRPVEGPCDTICDGVAVPYMTEEMFPLLEGLVSSTRLISEQQVKQAVRDLALYDNVVAEGSGALALAAALETPASERGKSVCLVTGGSIDPAKLAGILSPHTHHR